MYTCRGIYVDLDYECLRPITDLIEEKHLCLSYEPESHSVLFNKEPIVGNAFIRANRNNLLMRELVRVPLVNVTSGATVRDSLDNKFMHILQTTGPHMLTHTVNGNFYKSNFNDITARIVPSNILAPLSKNEAFQYINGNITQEGLQRIKSARAIHYFIESWVNKL